MKDGKNKQGRVNDEVLLTGRENMVVKETLKRRLEADCFKPETKSLLSVPVQLNNNVKQNRPNRLE